MRKTLLGALCALACTGTPMAADLAVIVNGQRYTATFDDDQFWNATRVPTQIYLPKGTVIASVRTPDNSVYSLTPQGALYKDAVPFGDGSLRASEVTFIGNTVYAKGLSSGKWSRWDTTKRSWVWITNELVQLLPTPTSTTTITPQNTAGPRISNLPTLAKR